MDEITQREDYNGIRFSWNVWPTNRIDAVSCSVPIGCLYTPLKQISDREPLNYSPVVCRGCGSVLNCYCHVDYNSKVWTCPICNARNPLPQSYHQMTETCQAAELHSDFTTVEYIVRQNPDFKPIFLFVVDTVAKEDRIQYLKSILLSTIMSLPPEAYVGFISYGNYVYLHELKVSEIPRSFVFSGNKIYEASELAQVLSLSRQTPEQPTNPFIMNIADAELMVNTIIDKLSSDPTQVEKGERPPRCTSTALHIASRLIEALYPTNGGQIILFTSGPITKGPATMATKLVKEEVRQHSDIEKGRATLTTSAIQFFTDLGAHCSERNITINYICAAFEETGLYELEPAILKTGGWVLTAETYSEERISQSLIKYFESIYPYAGTETTLGINSTKNFKIQGCIGPCTALPCKSNEVISDKQIGIGATNEWKLCGVLPSTTLAFFFDISHSKADPVPSSSNAIIQFVTKYTHIQTGQVRVRVTTSAIRFAELNNSTSLISQSFDQEAATVLLARLATWKVRDEDLLDVVHFIDRTLIRFCRKFGTYNKGDPQSFTLGQSFSVFPQFLYHFRRSPFMSTFNSSPDYTTTLRHALLTEDVTNSLFMIQPTLVQYILDNPPQPVLLDMSSLSRNCVLLLDTYFRVLVWHGKDIAQWRDAGYQNLPEYANLKVILEEPIAEANALISERFPTPILYVCDQDSSQSRFLLARCNPSNQQFEELGAKGADNLGSDEPSFSRFTQKLREVAVND